MQEAYKYFQTEWKEHASYAELNICDWVHGYRKTYFIDKHYRDKDVDILNVYDYQQRVYDKEGFGDSIPLGAQFRCLMKANNMLLSDIIEKLKQGRNVVVEQTFFKAKRHIAYIDEIRKAADVTIEVYVMCPNDELWESNLKKEIRKEDLSTIKSRLSAQ